MKLVIQKMADIQSLYVRYLRILLSVEESIALQGHMIVDAALDAELHDALQGDLLTTQEHAIQLRELLRQATDEVAPFKCKAINGLLDEAEEAMQDTASHPLVRDVVLTGTARRIKQYQLAVYEDARQLAYMLNRNADGAILDKSIHAGENMARKLSNMTDRIALTAK